MSAGGLPQIPANLVNLDDLTKYLTGFLSLGSRPEELQNVPEEAFRQEFRALLLKGKEAAANCKSLKEVRTDHGHYVRHVKELAGKQEAIINGMLEKETINERDCEGFKTELDGAASLLESIDLRVGMQDIGSFRNGMEKLKKAVAVEDTKAIKDQVELIEKNMPKKARKKTVQLISAMEALSSAAKKPAQDTGKYVWWRILLTVVAVVVGWLILTDIFYLTYRFLFNTAVDMYFAGSRGFFAFFHDLGFFVDPPIDPVESVRIMRGAMVLSIFSIIAGLAIFREKVKKFLKK